MSSGTPRSASMRLRHSQGYASSGDDIEDDASSRAPATMLPDPKAQTWTEIMENLLWFASAAFIVYFGDGRSNLISILWRDNRIRRTALYLGLAGTLCNGGIILYTILTAWDLRKADEKWEMLAPSVAPVVTTIGLLSFCLFSFALWRIWSFLTLPLLLTLLMASIVLSQFLVRAFKPQPEVFRTD